MLKKPLSTPANTNLVIMAREFPWIAFVLAGSLVPLLIVLASGHTLAWRDTSQLFAPMRALIAEALREGRLPLWNPYEATGMPLFAQLLHGVLHPWSLLAAFIAPGHDIDLLVVLHVATGAVGAGVLARTLGASRSGAAVAGLGYGLSGYLLGMSAVIQYLAAGGSAPWAVAGLCMASRGGAVRLLLGAAGMAMLFLAGDPQWAVVAALLGLLLAWGADGWRGVARAAAAAAAGTALAGIQLVPTWAFLQATSRGSGISLQDRMQWALAPARLIEFIVPGFFAGRPGPSPAPVFLWLGGWSAYPLPFLPSVFLGLPVLILAISGVLANRTSRLLGCAALFFLWLSLGHFAKASDWLEWIPVWSSFRYAEKLTGPFTLCVALLAALGLEIFIGSLLPRTVRPAFIGSLVAALLAIAAFGLVRFMPPFQFVPNDAWIPIGQRLGMGLLLAALGLAAIGGVGYRHSRMEGTASSGSTRWMLAIILLTGLAGSAAALHCGATDSRARTPLAELRKNGQVIRTITPVTDIALQDHKGLDNFDALQAVLSRSGAAPFNVPSHIDNFTVYTGLLPRRFNNLVTALNGLGDAKWIAFRRFALTHAVLTPPQSPAAEAEARAAVSGGKQLGFNREWDISVWEVPHRPWASFAERVLPVRDETEAVAAVARLESSGDRTVVLLGDPPRKLSPGTVHSIERSTDTVRVVAEAPGDGLLVVADAFWDGWKATVDGRPVGIELADGLVRGVRWPAGRHLLEMRYHPAEVGIGAAISGITALFLLGFVVWERRRCKQQTHDDILNPVR